MSQIEKMDNLDKKLFILMKHAEDLQKNCEKSKNSLDEGIKGSINALQESAKEIQANASQSFKFQVEEIEKIRKSFLKFALGGVILIISIAAIFSYLPYKYYSSAVEELKFEKSKINHKLAGTANVFQDRNGIFWVEIKSTKAVGILDGKSWAELPKK